MPRARLLPLLSLICLVCCLAPLPAAAQFATLRGQTVDAGGDPLTGVNVVLRSDDGRLAGAASDNGYYLLARILPGDYQLSVSYVGFVTITDSVTFAAGDSRVMSFTLVENEAAIDTVVVESERASANDSPAGLSVVRPRSLTNLPSPALSRDLASAIAWNSSVVTAGDRGGQLYVRGGTPMQNLYILDGMRILQPLHILNSYSVFPADILSYADIYAGGFGAYYGGRVAAVFDVNTINGSKKRFAGSVSLAPFLASAHAEIPIVKEKVSLVVSGRESLLKEYGDVALGSDLPYSFGDLFAKVHAFLNETSNVSVTAMHSHDSGNLAGTDLVNRKISWTNDAIGLNYFYLSTSIPVLTEISVNTTRFAMQKGPPADPDQSTEVGGFEGTFNFAYLAGDYQLHFGIFAQTAQFRYQLDRRPVNLKEEFVTEGGAFIEGRLDFPFGLHAVPGFRIQAFPSRGQTFGEPRLRIDFPAPNLRDFRISAAWGLYHQEVLGLTDDRVVSDVFTAWAPSPDFQPVPSSRHLLAGISGPLGRTAFVELELYDRSTRHVAFPVLGEPLGPNTLFIDTHSMSRGADLRLRVQRQRWFASAAYTLASTKYSTETGSFRPPHDRRHSIALTAGTTIRGFAVSAGWQYGSGLPFTTLGGYYQDVPVGDEESFHRATGADRLVFDESYRGRLPAIHRLDLSVERSTELARFAKLTLQASVINAYDRRNWFDLDYLTQEKVYQLPFIPSVGVRIDYR